MCPYKDPADIQIMKKNPNKQDNDSFTFSLEEQY
jgi:hypothetical protein